VLIVALNTITLTITQNKEKTQFPA
jgi:hypothetical protein